MGKNKSTKSLQRSAEVEGAISDNYNNTLHTKGLSQKQIEERVNKVHEIFGDWPKVDIRRALEENEYDDDRVIKNHLDGVDQWQSVKKKTDQPTGPRPKITGPRRQEGAGRGIQSDRGAERGGRGRGRGAVGRTSSSSNYNQTSTEPLVKEYNTTPSYDITSQQAEDQPTHSRAYRSFAEVAAFVVEEPQPVVVAPVETTTVTTYASSSGTNDKKKRNRKNQQPDVETTIVTTTTTIPAATPGYAQVVNGDYVPSSLSSTVEQETPIVQESSPVDVLNSNEDTIVTPEQIVTKTVSPTHDSASIILPNATSYNNRLNVQFGSLGINDVSNAGTDLASAPQQEETSTSTITSVPSAQSNTQTTTQSTTNADYGYSQSWGNDVNDPYNSHAEMQYVEDAGHVDPSLMGVPYQQSPYNAFGGYGAHPHHPSHAIPTTGARTGTDPNTAQRTSPNSANAPYGNKVPPGAPYGQPPYPGVNLQPSGYQYPYYMMPNQFQYYNYPGFKQTGTHFYHGKPYGYGMTGPGATGATQTTTTNSSTGATTTGNTTTNSTAPPQDEDYSKQFMEQQLQQQQQYYYMSHMQPHMGATNTNAVPPGSDKLKGKDGSRGGDAQQQGAPLTMEQQQMGYGFYPQHIPYMGNSQYNYMFHTQPQYSLQHQYQPTQHSTSGQQASQAHNAKSGRDQQQQSSLSSGWQ